MVLAGRPNVGKSRLAERPGRLRAGDRRPDAGDDPRRRDRPRRLDGWPVELADTAGLRDADRPDRGGRASPWPGPARARPTSSCSCSTARSPLSGGSVDHGRRIPTALRVANKADLPAAWDALALAAARLGRAGRRHRRTLAGDFRTTRGRAAPARRGRPVSRKAGPRPCPLPTPRRGRPDRRGMPGARIDRPPTPQGFATTSICFGSSTCMRTCFDSKITLPVTRRTFPL